MHHFINYKCHRNVDLTDHPYIWYKLVVFYEQNTNASASPQPPTLLLAVVFLNAVLLLSPYAPGRRTIPTLFGMVHLIQEYAPHPRRCQQVTELYFS